MMDWRLILSYFFTNELRLLLGLYLVARMEGFRLERKTWILAVLGGCAVTALQAATLSEAGAAAAEMLLLAAVCWRALRERLNLCLFVIFFYEVCVGLWDFLASAALGVLFRSERFIETNQPEHLLGVWLVRLLMLGMALGLAARNARKAGLRKDSPHNAGAMRLASVLALLGFFCAVTLSEQEILPLEEDRVGRWIILSMVLLFAVLFYRLSRQRELEGEVARLKEEQAEILERNYQNLRRTYADNAKLYHDLHNHIEAIYQCLVQGDVEEAVEYLGELRTPVREISQTVWTGDKAVDYLIGSKLGLAEQKKIKTEVNMEYPRNTNIRSVDLTTILGNLLDNALEAAGGASESLRFIRLTIRRIHFMLLIKVENGCDEAPAQENGELLTSKADKRLHGWGLKSVQTAAERYDGTVCTRYGDGVFTAVVTLSFQPVKAE